MEGNGESGEDVRDERGGSAEGFGEDGAALEKDIVAVITDNENAFNWGVLGVRDGGGYHGGEKVRKGWIVLCWVLGSWRIRAETNGYAFRKIERIHGT
ncbi:hypothetical protein V6N13_058643 [Hibiscus sabdariffa]|uniref:Uncharacterized protein n=2 Tax=Hibiscus sabdariffa TaxID=183260 RepID=A0ABR2GFG9_9ROSI